MHYLSEIGVYLTNLLTGLGVWGAVLGCFFILFESIIPPVPLSIFITLNFLVFGPIVGFIISWVFTCLGCMLSYYIFKKGISDKYLEKLRKNDKFNRILKKINKMSISSLVLLIAIPFTPAFLVNIAAGIARIDTKKFFTALLIGKVSLVYFWGFVGVSIVEAFTRPIVLLRVVPFVLALYFISKLLSNKFDL